MLAVAGGPGTMVTVASCVVRPWTVMIAWPTVVGAVRMPLTSPFTVVPKPERVPADVVTFTTVPSATGLP